MEFLLQPLGFEFMVKAIAVSALVGAVCATLSCYLILIRWSLMGDAVSHSVLPGVVISYMLGLPFGIGAFVFGLASVIMIGFIKARTRIKEDAVIGIVFTALFALGIILISKVPSSVDLMHVLFGYVLGISDADALQTFGIGAFTLFILLLLKKDLLLYCFDQTHARAIGLNTTFLRYLLLTLLALTVVSAMQTVGVILVIAMLITPGSTAYLLTDRFDRMLITAQIVGVGSCVVGAYASYYFDISTGGAIVVFQALIFLVAMTFAPKYGLLKLKK